MSAQHDGKRFWQVQAVFACEADEGPGFAYTMGLATRGLAELHMWDRPTHGDDPGADFNLSSADLCHILNDFADEWVVGSFGIGDVREVSLDDGLTKAVVTFGEPVDADSVEAWGARPSLVVPLAWSLHRPPRGGMVEIMAHAREAYERDVRAVAAMCDPRVAVSGARLHTDTIGFDVDGPYGPLSALVEAHARAVAGAAEIDILIDNALAAEVAMSPRALMGRMATLSRLSGRDEQLDQVRRLAGRVMDRLSKRRVWRDRVAEVAQACEMSLSRARANLDDLVRTSTTCMLTGIALDDVLPEDMVLASQGPWRATLSSTGADPGQRWRCSTTAEQLIRETFASMDACVLLDLSQAMFGPVSDLLGHDLLVVEGRALTRAVAPPPVTDMVLTQCRATASMPRILHQLSLFAQLVATVIDGAFDLDDDRAAELERVLGWPIGDDWRNAA